MAHRKTEAYEVTAGCGEGYPPLKIEYQPYRGDATPSALPTALELHITGPEPGQRGRETTQLAPAFLSKDDALALMHDIARIFGVAIHAPAPVYDPRS